jgi:hypothetical protein
MGTPAQMVTQQTQPAGRLIQNSAKRQPGGRIMRSLTAFVVCCTLASVANATNSPTDTPSQTVTATSPLVAKFHELKDQLAQSLFGSPILLNSETDKAHAQGEVYALLDAPFAAIEETLSQPAQWCELAILHVNIKTCTYHKDQLNFFVGRKYYQTPSQAYVLQYHFKKRATDDHQLNITLTAPDGPFGTSHYLIQLEAIPADAQHSFIHFQYRYQFGFAARIAMQTYLATFGRDKVGFTQTGTNDNGEPTYIQGLQGVIERNVMRYIFAIESVLEARKFPAEYRHTEQLVRWYTHIQKYPQQLVELTREEYMDNKQRERSNQLEAQKALLP